MPSLGATLGLAALGLCLPRPATAKGQQQSRAQPGYRIDPPEAAVLVDGDPATTLCAASGRLTVVFDKRTRIDAVSIPHDLAYVVLEVDGGYVEQDYGTAGQFGFSSRLVTSVSILFTPTCFGELTIRAGSSFDLLAAVRPAEAIARSAGELARAANDIRALRLALEECDAEAMSWWIQFPLTIRARTYQDARALRAACRREQIPLLDAAALEVALATAGADEQGMFHIALAEDWRFAWRRGQWWLVDVD